MQTRLADRLEAARKRRFVGRDEELARFVRLLEAPDPGLLAVHGPAGVGKTTLLRRFADVAVERGVTLLSLDARDLPSAPDAVEAAFARLLDGGTTGRAVVLVDTYELLADLDDWFRRDLLPRLPADTLVVLAGRHPPAARWRADPGWADVLETLSLRNLSPAESREYLRVIGVPEAEHQGCLAFTHGHPLALALAGEVARAGGDVSPRDRPDLIRDLLDRLLGDLPTPACRAALEACAEVRELTEPLLAALLGQDDVADLFDWLRGLPVVAAGPSGLHPHDLAREVLGADLRWRDPARHLALHTRAREYYLDALPRADAVTRQRLLLDLMYLHTGLRALLPDGAADATGLRMTPLATGGTADADAVVAMVAVHEGPEAAALARHWLDRFPGAWLVVREPSGTPAGAMLLLPLQETGEADADADPAVAAALTALSRRPPLRPGERATHLRFWLARDTYQQISPAQNLIAAQLALHYLTTNGLAITFMPVADAGYWAAFCAYADLVHLPAADFTVGGRTYAVFGHDWRAVPVQAWVAMLAERETSPLPVEPPSPPDDVTVLVLSRDEFAASVRDALRDLQRPDRLARNPLLRSRLVAAPADPADGVATLRAVIDAAAESIAASPRDAKGYRALNRTYLRPAGSQERAAEVLGLPSSTFRRHLAAGVDRLVEVLWDRELGATRQP
jgi:hypothetical protein